MSAHAVYAAVSHFCYVGVFGDLRDPVVPTLKGFKWGCCDSICLPPPPFLSYALVQATVGVETVIIPYIGVAYTRGGGY